MFLKKNYILANELVEKMGIHIANISMLRNQFEDDDDYTTLIKMNNCTMIKSNSHKLPNNIKNGILSNTFTDLTDKLPCNFVKDEYDLSESDLKKADIIKDKVKISGKNFYVFKEDFINKVKNKIVYILNEDEAIQCYKKKQIDGYIKVTQKKYITWY